MVLRVVRPGPVSEAAPRVARESQAINHSLADTGSIWIGSADLSTRSKWAALLGSLRTPSWSDNSGAESAASKLFCTAMPLAIFVQKLALLTWRVGVHLNTSHIPLPYPDGGATFPLIATCLIARA